ncbi:hypothetical protein [Actinoplanes ianthinogenes]|nr:hypothetical protein [Actinoplanes ianthinogenes]
MRRVTAAAAANEPPLAAISGYGDVARYRNGDNVTVYLRRHPR